MIIDSHTHIGRGERLDDTYQIDRPLDLLLQGMEEAGVDVSCVAGVAYEDYAFCNREVYEAVQAHPGRLIGFARTNLHRADALEEVRRCFDGYGFRGVKLHPTMGDGFPTRGLMELLSDYRWPLLLHTPTKVEVIDAYAHLARAYPAVPVIMGHMGAYGADWPGYTKLCAIEAKQYPNLYLDTASIFMHSWVKLAGDICGAEKVLFGSDASVIHPAITRKMIEVAGFTGAEQSLILGGTARRLLRLDED